MRNRRVKLEQKYDTYTCFNCKNWNTCETAYMEECVGGRCLANEEQQESQLQLDIGVV